MISTKQLLIGLLLLTILAGTTAILFMFVEAKSAELRRKRDADALAIRDALVLYMKQHDGALPSSISELKFRREDIDSSPFKLMPPGTRSGRRNQDVIAEAKEGGKGRYRILIYADGTVDWE